MMKSIFLFFALVGSIFAQTAISTDPVGFLNVTVQPNSDAILATPLNGTADFRGVIQSISGSVITVAGPSPAWAASRYVQNLPSQPKTYAVYFATGIKEGMTAKITENGTNTITIQLDSGDDLTGVTTEATTGAGLGDQIDIIPYWTPLSVVSGTIPNLTEMYLFDNATVGKNVSPTLLLQYSAGAWYETIGFTDQSNRAILFGCGFIIRNNAASIISLSFAGSVPMAKHRSVLRTLAVNTAQDQTIGYMSPVPEALNAVGLGAQNNDELYLFDNSLAGKNKAPSLLLLLFDGRWYDSITFIDVTDSVILQPGNAMIYRKVGTASSQNFVWQDLQTYLQ